MLLCFMDFILMDPHLLVEDSNTTGNLLFILTKSGKTRH